MNATEKLKELMSLCKSEICLEINHHTLFYDTVTERIKELREGMRQEGISDVIVQRMIETNTVIELSFYPDTPIGSYTLFHYDLDMILEEAVNCIKEEKGLTS